MTTMPPPSRPLADQLDALIGGCGVRATGDAVIVVESHERGGSFHTVDAADARGQPAGSRNDDAAARKRARTARRRAATGSEHDHLRASRGHGD